VATTGAPHGYYLYRQPAAYVHSCSLMSGTCSLPSGCAHCCRDVLTACFLSRAPLIPSVVWELFVPALTVLVTYWLLASAVVGAGGATGWDGLQAGIHMGSICDVTRDAFVTWAEAERPICDVGEVERRVQDVGEVERRVRDVGSGVAGHRLLQSKEGMVGACCMFTVVIVGETTASRQGKERESGQHA
jgi:hypothetical protein